MGTDCISKLVEEVYRTQLKLFMGHVRKIIVNGQVLLEVDYSNANGDQMIALLKEAAEIVRSENEKVLILSCFNRKNFVTPDFIRNAEAEVGQLKHLITKQAIVGLSFTQEIILKGLNIFLQRNFKSFKTRDDAIQYLLDNSTEADLPDYYKR